MLTGPQSMTQAEADIYRHAMAMEFDVASALTTSQSGPEWMVHGMKDAPTKDGDTIGVGSAATIAAVVIMLQRAHLGGIEADLDAVLTGMSRAEALGPLMEPTSWKQPGMAELHREMMEMLKAVRIAASHSGVVLKRLREIGERAAAAGGGR